MTGRELALSFGLSTRYARSFLGGLTRWMRVGASSGCMSNLRTLIQIHGHVMPMNTELQWCYFRLDHQQKCPTGSSSDPCLPRNAWSQRHDHAGRADCRKESLNVVEPDLKWRPWPTSVLRADRSSKSAKVSFQRRRCRQEGRDELAA